jgi:ferric-dicitrate binding protein FerR (iron transport regulator)
MSIKNRISQYLNGTYSTEDVNRMVNRLRKEEDSRTALQESMDAVWEESAAHAAASEEEREKFRLEAAALLKQIKQTEAGRRMKKTKQLSWKKAASVAAAVVVMAMAGWLVNNHSQPFGDTAEYVSVTTSFGEIKTTFLPDGTRITLNACSQIVYPQTFSGNERKIRLNGEAFFKVTRNEKQPFIVSAGQFDVTVLGTEFNVKNYDRDAIHSVEVKSGKVQVDIPDATIRLKADEQFKIDLLSDEYAKSGENKDVAAWRKGHLSFKQTPLRDVANELERTYKCEIQFQQGKIFNNLISGEHSNESLESVLKSIELTTGIHFKFIEKGKKILFYK